VRRGEEVDGAALRDEAVARSRSEEENAAALAASVLAASVLPEKDHTATPSP
jgi:hypothetical protein